jgi:CHASE1-domain containing sensor protein
VHADSPRRRGYGLRADGAPEFKVRTAGNAADLFVVRQIEPLLRNREALGFDVAATPCNPTGR